ncbi:hypothetical protein [Pseudomonas sp. PA15(2017)]|uniref:hypothetical protein n=1 Tax=Pseudomonas sp. PA15(2017) TaxID=1932111 RepID=UPI001179AD89|nr:hypothetical protein [Pseudomonas sp. PA15(2017)]
MIDMRRANNRFALLKVIFLIYVVWLILYSMLGVYLNDIIKLYRLSDEVLLVQHNMLIFFLNPGLAGIVVVFIGVAVMHLLVYLKLTNYSWTVNAVILTTSFIVTIIFLLIGLWVKGLSNTAMASGNYLVCPYGEQGYSRASDHGGNKVYRFALLPMRPGVQCR